MPSLLFVTQVDVGRDSGNARHVLALCEALAKEGVDLTLLAPGRARSPSYRHVKPFDLGPGARLEAVEAAFTARLVRKTKPDLAYVRLAPSSLIVPQVLSALHLPYFLELNGPILDQISTAGRPRVITKTIARGLKAAVERSRGLVLPSAILGRWAEQHLEARAIHIVENGVDLDGAKPLDRTAARRALNLPLDRVIVTLVGTLTPVLRLDLLLEAVATLYDVTLVICGDGAQRARVDAARSERVIWLGAQPHAEAIRAIAAADVCVNVHDTDLSLKSLEYAACGRRQVAFDVEGLERIVDLYRDVEGVVLVRERSAAALRDGLLAALKLEREKGLLSEEAVAKARAQLGWDHKAKRLFRLFFAPK